MGKSRFIKTLFILSFCIAILLTQSLFASDVIITQPDRMTVTTDINSTESKVWDVLVDFKNYPQWNSWYRIEGEAKLGALIKAYSKDQHLDLQVTKIDEGSVCWVDVTWFTHLGMGGWRCRSVWKNPIDNRVKFTNHFEFTGPLRIVLKVAARKMLLNGMIQENHGLKNFVERK